MFLCADKGKMKNRMKEKEKQESVLLTRKEKKL
jgi:hypothetical protein